MRLSLTLLAFVIACGGADAAPSIAYGENTPDDLRNLAATTYALVLEAFPAQRACLEGVTLSGAWELADRARYDPDAREIVIRIPATAPQLEVSLVHELAHHMEFSCSSQAEIRTEFLRAQNLDPNGGWFDGSTWETTPSEQWASAVVRHVLRRPDERARTPITDVALEIVKRWADPQ